MALEIKISLDLFSAFGKKILNTKNKKLEKFLDKNFTILIFVFPCTCSIFLFIKFYNYNLLSNSLDDYNNKLFQIKKNFYDSKTFQSNEKEDRLIKFLDNYIDLLSKTILQLKLISLKLDDVFSYSLDDYDKDLNTWEKLRDEYINEGQFLNFLLDDFLLSIE